MNDKIHAFLCVPGKDYPGCKNIVAKVIDGSDIKLFTFGPHQNIRHIWGMIPRILADSKFKRTKR